LSRNGCGQELELLRGESEGLAEAAETRAAQWRAREAELRGRAEEETRGHAETRESAREAAAAHGERARELEQAGARHAARGVEVVAELAEVRRAFPSWKRSIFDWDLHMSRLF
jgi:hypothetical protein